MAAVTVSYLRTSSISGVKVCIKQLNRLKTQIAQDSSAAIEAVLHFFDAGAVEFSWQWTGGCSRLYTRKNECCFA
jgi:hypothetical protein